MIAASAAIEKHMTLVLARIVQGAIFLVGDTKLILERTKEKVSTTRGVLKTKVVSDGLAVSFAGNQYIADNALQSLHKADNVDGVLDHLLKAHRSTRNEDSADFIVSSLEPLPVLYSVKDGTVVRSDVAWIGSGEGFRLFRAYELGEREIKPKSLGGAWLRIVQLAAGSEEPPPGIETYTRMLSSMNEVVDDEELPDVGGFAIPLIGWNGKFSYMGYADVRTHPLQFEPGVGVVPFGTAEEGGYALDVVPFGDNRGVSSYFVQGDFGILYRDADGGWPKAQLVPRVSPITFMQEGSKLAGTAITTYYANVRELCRRALEKLSAGDELGALKEADGAIAWNSQSADGWKCRGDIKLKLNRTSEALADFERLWRLPRTMPTLGIS
jgi:hypothetical protein